MTGNRPYRFPQLLSGIVMLLALAWLTMSLPFVYAAQQAQKTVMQNQDAASTDEEANALTNTTEEKSESGMNTLSEYLHEAHHAEHPTTLVVKSYNRQAAGLYIAFHPDAVCPPPDVLAS